MKVTDNYGRLKVVRTEANANRVLTRKTATETVNSSATYQDDDQLRVTVPAGETWSMVFYVFFDTGTTPDIKFRLNDTGGTSIASGIWGLSGGRSTFSYHSTDFSNSESGQAYLASGSPMYATISALVTAAAGGAASIALQWAQNTSTASNTDVLVGSYVIAEKMT